MWAQGLLKGEYVKVTPEVRRLAPVFVNSGGSPIGNSRVKLTNVKDCVKRGLVQEGQDPQKVAADQLVKDGVTVLHTIGGDDTNTAAADLAAFLKRNQYSLTVVGLPKTIDNDVYPIKLSLGAMTAAQQGAIFFENVVNEHSANPRMLIVHEVRRPLRSRRIRPSFATCRMRTNASLRRLLACAAAAVGPRKKIAVVPAIPYIMNAARQTRCAPSAARARKRPKAPAGPCRRCRMVKITSEWSDREAKN